MLFRAGLQSMRTLPRTFPRSTPLAAPLAPRAPRALPTQALSRRSVGGVSEREPGNKVPKDVVPLITAVSFALLLGIFIGARHFQKDPTLRTHREDAVDREPTDKAPPAPEWEKSPRAGGRH
ncbi:hypothetical protein A1Q2_00658 [Trichosporon asahii var. asahii CBS 8904]|uniref:Uncharacterized protein n=2 Tax=Trichosporon asahii var. asahii TaxID=189963 RepID=K1VX13_TRIAC|nr:hypothetical protein A1Q1_03395 [Trichosporon asahii var. asahii CBS 2479]EJT52593.1 hypothetical protein A1Q1_03395 [Trichosporon asahii var. asahii CBS 2479]EKD05051.1 hypothetical protein A1Q2_00658 [Trichosporon asahii var. asahii CBS 8904]